MARLRHRDSGVVVNVSDDRVMGAAWEPVDKGTPREATQVPVEQPAAKRAARKAK